MTKNNFGRKNDKNETEIFDILVQRKRPGRGGDGQAIPRPPHIFATMKDNNIIQVFDDLQAVSGQLREGQLSYVQSCLKQYREKKQLSEKQILTLTSIRKWVQ